jgi:hypothetical protein
MKILILRNAERGKLCPIFVLIKKGNEQKLTRRARAHIQISIAKHLSG